jgi:hypothetical protein
LNLGIIFGFLGTVNTQRYGIVLDVELVFEVRASAEVVELRVPGGGKQGSGIGIAR